MLRFAPKKIGTWQYRIRVQDNSNYPNWTESSVKTFSTSSARSGIHGFVKVSTRDPRYFEFSDGTPFTGTGINAADSGIYHAEKRAEAEFKKYAAGNTNFNRTWMDMESIWSRGTHGWDGWRNSSGTSDSLRSVEQVFNDHDFSIKLSGGNSYIAQYSQGSQEMTGGLDFGKSYIVRVTANLQGVSASSLQVKLLSDNSNFGSTKETYAPSGSWQITDLGNGWNRYESVFTNSRGRFTFSWSNALAIGITSGTAAYIDEIYIGEDLGGGKVGPNVVFKGKMNYHQYFDHIPSSNYDEIFSLAERYGLHLKPVITDKEDEILTRIRLDNGTFDPNETRKNSENFYSWKGYKVRRLHEYWWRYLAARWGYARGIHSWELVNEGDPGSDQHYHTTNHLAQTINTLDHNHMATTSFWTSFPATKFWGNPTYESVDYADVHAYISTGWIKDRSLESDAAKYHIVYSDATRDMLLATGKNMPIVRGEAGLDVLETQNEQDALANDINGVWLHNYTWAMLHSGGMYELYWWSDNIRSKPGPDGDTSNGLFDIFVPYNDFMGNIPLNAGGYVDINVSAPSGTRVVGQKNNNGSGSNKAHLWIQDTNHKWRSPGSGNLSGSITISGMKASTSFAVEFWRFNTKGQLTKSSQNISSNSSGQLTINFSPSSYNGSAIVDTAVKIGNYGAIPTPPTGTSTQTPTPHPNVPGDGNNDGKVDGQDFIIWLTHYGQNVSGANNGDYNGDNQITISDYLVWVNNY